MNKKYPVILTDIERPHLQDLISAGTAPARLLMHARILLKADQRPNGPAWVDAAIAEAVEVSQPTVARIRKQFVEQGLDAALHRRAPRRQYQRKSDGAHEVQLIALACSEPPKGQACWSLRLLADKLVELEIVEEVSYQTVGRVLKKRTQALAEATVEYPTQGQRRVRLPHGGCALGLYPSVRSTLSAGLHG